ncbi:MAG: hypothetical protein AAF591_10135 [Verrucomicrobiota bacterium]
MREIVMRRGRVWVLGVGVLGILWSAGAAHGDVSIVHYPDGREISGTVVAVGEKDFRWRLDGSRDEQTTPYSQVEWIEFPPLDGWDDAQLLLEDGQYEEAAAYFDEIASVRHTGNYHPAPGNFATLAQLRALDCYRRVVNLERIVALARLFEPELLPPSEEPPGVILGVWADVGAGDWEEAKVKLDAIEGIAGDSREAIELGYLRGVVFSELGQPDVGLTELAKTYTINLGTEPDIARAAIQKSTDILVSMELAERMPEVKGLVHLYAGIYGGQELWDGASADLAALKDKDTQLEYVAGRKARETQELGMIEAKAKPGEENVLFRVDFDPGRRQGNLSDPEFNILKKDDGTFEFKGVDSGHSYVLTGVQARGEEVKYEPGKVYAFSITGYAPEGSKLAKCFVELGFEDDGQFEALARWDDFVTSGAKEGFENRRRIEVTTGISADSPGLGKPVSIRVSGNGGKEIRFVSDGVVEVREEGAGDAG